MTAEASIAPDQPIWYRPVAAALAALHLALWGFVVLVGWLYWDDFILQGQAARLGLGADLLLRNHDGHFMPLTFLTVWAIEEISGLNYTLVALSMLFGQLLFVAAALLVVRELLGRGLPALVALGSLLLSPLIIPGFTWWAEALMLVPLMTCGMFATVTHVRYLRTGSPAALVTTFALVIVALGFFEKSLLIVGWLFLVTVMVAPEASFLRAAAGGLRQRWRLWLAWTTFLAMYFLAYAQFAQGRTRLPTGPGQLLETVYRALVHTLAPGLIGGPANWTPVDSSASYADPSPLLMILGVLFLVAAIWAGVRRPGASRKAWLAAAIYFAAELSTYAIGRLGPDGDPAIVQAARYVQTSVFPISIAIGATVSRYLDLLRNERVRTFAGAAVAGFVLLSAFSTFAYANIWADNPAKPYISNVRADMAAADPGVPLLDQEVPHGIMLPVTHPYNLASWFLAPLRQQPGFADSTSRLQMVDSRGRLIPARIEGPDAPQPESGCYQVAPGQSTRIPLNTPLIAWLHTVALDYDADSAGLITVTIGDGSPVTASTRSGSHKLFVRAEGGQTSITVSSTQPDVCIRAVKVGAVVPDQVLYGGSVDITDQLRGGN